MPANPTTSLQLRVCSLGVVVPVSTVALLPCSLHQPWFKNLMCTLYC